MMKTGSQQSAYNLISALISEKLQEEKRGQFFRELISQPITASLLAVGVRALNEKMIPVLLPQNAIDTCGTGGSGKRTINTSTLTAFIVAAAGGKVAKHGNRSASGHCGSFDLLEELGVRIDLTPEEECRVFGELGIVFLFASQHHPSLRFIAPLRKQYGKKTLFNLIGPLCNPAGVKRQLLGTGSEEHAVIISEALRMLGTFESTVVTGCDGLDEVTVTAETTVRTVMQTGVQRTVFSPESLSLPLSTPKEIVGGTPSENAAIFLELANGIGDVAKRNLVLVNAAHALLLTDLVSSIDEAFALVSETLSSGKVYGLFERYRDLSHSL